MTDIRDAQLDIVPRDRKIEKRLICPECNHSLPVDERTECDRCGAHLRLKVSVEAPAIGQ